MKTKRIFTSVFMAVVLALISFTNAIAMPPWPSSFSGTVKINGANVPAGTVVTAWCGGIQYSYSAYMEYNGDTVYAFNVPGDDPATSSVVEGCTSGQWIIFKIGQLVADQGRSWTSGTDNYLNLTATDTGPASFTISGYVGLVDVTLSYTDGTAKTAMSDESGNFSLSVSHSWSGTVTPLKTGFTFTPASRTYTNVLTDQTGQDYTATPTTQSIPLVVGWNLVSFILHPADTSTASVLSSLGSEYSLVYAWDATTASWLIYDPNLGQLNDLKNLDERMGFWIRMKTSQTLVVSGDAPDNTNIDLKSGWNLVGYPSVSNGLLPDAISAHGVGTDFSLIYAYHANEGSAAWKLFDRAGNPLLNDLTALASGWGYWVKANADHTWIVP